MSEDRILISGKPKLAISLTPEEKSWLSEHNSFRVAGPEKVMTFEWLKRDGIEIIFYYPGMILVYIVLTMGC